MFEIYFVVGVLTYLLFGRGLVIVGNEVVEEEDRIPQWAAVIAPIIFIYMVCKAALMGRYV